MFKFFRNLFRKKNHTIHEADLEVIIDKEKGTMKIITSRYLSEKDIREIFRKYVLGE